MSETLPLKDFIESSLAAICDAIDNTRLKHRNVAPKLGEHPNHYPPTQIDFDIAVTIEKSEEKNSESGAKIDGSVGVRVLGFGSKVSGDINNTKNDKETNNYSNANRIKFSVPVFFMFNEEKYIENKNKSIESQKSFERNNRI